MSESSTSWSALLRRKPFTFLDLHRQERMRNLTRTAEMLDNEDWAFGGLQEKTIISFCVESLSALESVFPAVTPLGFLGFVVVSMRAMSHELLSLLVCDLLQLLGQT